MQYKGFDLYTNPDRQVARYGEFQDNITEIFNITKNYSSGDYIYIKLTRIPDRIYSIITIDKDNNENTLNSNEFSLEENGYIKILINNQIKAIRILYSGTGSLVSAEDIWELKSGTLMDENFELRGNAIIDKDLRIKGNLFLEGDTSIIDFSQTNELKIKDKLAYLNFGNNFSNNTDYGLKILNNTDDKFGLIFNNDEFSINKYASGQVIKYASFLSNGINLNINNDTVIKITSDKKVGILNSSPSGTLSIFTSYGNIHFGGQYPDLWFDGGSDSIFFISNRGASNGRTSITYNNTELLSVLNNGNVGIGDTSPSEKLSVTGNIIFNTNQDVFIGTKNNYSLKLRTNNTDRIIITNNGNVGIGTSTITDKLTVNGSISSTSIKTNLIDVSNGNGTFKNLTVNLNANFNGPTTLSGTINLDGDIYRNGQQLHWDNLVFFVETRIGDGTTKDFILNGNPIENSLIVSKNGIILIAGIDYNISGNAVSFDEPPANGSKLRFQYTKYISSVTNVTQMLLSCNNSWTGQNYFLNKVGIGTTNPIQQLHVNGNVYISDNVGFGTSVPLNKIQIKGTDVGVETTPDWLIRVSKDFSVSNGLGAGPGILLSHLATDGHMGVSDSSNTKRAGISAPAEDTAYSRAVGLAFWTSAFDSPISEKVRITGSGNVGIGTTNPTEKLEVNGNIKVSGAIYGSGPRFINPVTVASGSGRGVSVDWTTFDASSYIPIGASAVILEYEAAMSSPDSGDVDAYIRIRKDSSSPAYVLARGRASSSGDNVAWGGQGVFPITSNRTFQYSIDYPGFEYGWVIRLIGYYY